ncbi:MAG: M23 family metallopeptidase [Bacilli bacterium]
MDDIYTYKRKKKKKNHTDKIMILIITILSTMIVLKQNPKLKDNIFKKFYESNINFASINEVYKSFLGDVIPLKATTKTVFNEKLEYTNKEKYLDGVKLNVKENYLVPAATSGLVVFIGEKENYGNTIIIQQVDGIDLMYGNLNTISVKLYDYIEKGKTIGDTLSTNLYLVYKKEGKILNYEEYIKG